MISLEVAKQWFSESWALLKNIETKSFWFLEKKKTRISQAQEHCCPLFLRVMPAEGRAKCILQVSLVSVLFRRTVAHSYSKPGVGQRGQPLLPADWEVYKLCYNILWFSISSTVVGHKRKKGGKKREWEKERKKTLYQLIVLFPEVHPGGSKKFSI